MMCLSWIQKGESSTLEAEATGVPDQHTCYGQQKMLKTKLVRSLSYSLNDTDNHNLFYVLQNVFILLYL